MAKKKWSDLSRGQKGVAVAVSAVDAGLRVWAGQDLASRSAADVNGPKWAWATGLSLVNSMGILPVIYLLRGRKNRSQP
ncbi:DUF5652 family protein [Gordonia phosphorivorans]|uniref:DUF5652 family protein n=1 Tax=Gordonia phosphorivorans TaxID=1056982 RepID=A0ABV6H510_9ACTN